MQALRQPLAGVGERLTQSNTTKLNEGNKREWITPLLVAMA